VFSALCSFGLLVLVPFQHQGMLLLPTRLCQARLLTVILCSDLISRIGRYKRVSASMDNIIREMLYNKMLYDFYTTRIM
jgi:hypothetical protein